MLTTEEANAYIRMTLKGWKRTDIKIEWAKDRPSVLGTFNWTRNKITLTPRILRSPALFREVFLHELAHALDYAERGTFLVKKNHVAHGKNWRKWCWTLGIPARRFIPVYEKACTELA